MTRTSCGRALSRIRELDEVVDDAVVVGDDSEAEQSESESEAKRSIRSFERNARELTECARGWFSSFRTPKVDNGVPSVKTVG